MKFKINRYEKKFDYPEEEMRVARIFAKRLFKEFGEQTRVVIDISGYRQERERKLIELAISASDKARFINKSVALYPMNSYERKIVHEKISTLDGVSSISEGEGYNRRVIIVPQSSSSS